MKASRPERRTSLDQESSPDEARAAARGGEKARGVAGHTEAVTPGEVQDEGRDPRWAPASPAARCIVAMTIIGRGETADHTAKYGPASMLHRGAGRGGAGGDVIWYPSQLIEKEEGGREREERGEGKGAKTKRAREKGKNITEKKR